MRKIAFLCDLDFAATAPIESGGNILTSIALSIVAQWLADGMIHERGALPPKVAVPAVPFFKELERRGIRTTVTEIAPL